MSRAVKYKNDFSEFFNLEQGVLKALCPLTFSLYLNDFENSLIMSNCEDDILQEISLFFNDVF